MTRHADIFKGVLHGKTIELERAPALPDGQSVTVSLQAENGSLPSPCEGLRRSFGMWRDQDIDFDEFLRKVYRDRDDDRGAS